MGKNLPFVEAVSLTVVTDAAGLLLKLSSLLKRRLLKLSYRFDDNDGDNGGCGGNDS